MSKKNIPKVRAKSAAAALVHLIAPKDSDCNLPAMSRLRFCEGMLNAVLVSASGEHSFWPEALSDDSIELIEKHIEAIIEEIRKGSPAELATAAILKGFSQP
jgi:hypothetical protein